MGVLFSLTSNNVPFQWDYTHQCAFEEIKCLALKCRDHHQVLLNYSPGVPPINIVTDASATGVAGVVSQGEDWRTAKIAAFYSAKLNKAQQNYPVHELEMPAGLKTMMRHHDLLQGVHFQWYTDHKDLVHMLEQKDLSARQARWLEKFGMFDFEVIYVPSVHKTCSVCMRSKPNNHQPYGLLHPLRVPTQPWDSIGIDFVGPLPISETRDGKYDMITVIIDRLTGMVHLVSSREDYTSKNVAELVFLEVYKHHGLPCSIVSDRDKLFTATSWDHLHSLIRTKLQMSSAYHPETDGVTERANRTITQMIQQCIGPKQPDWALKLPAIEFAINSAQSETTGAILPQQWENAPFIYLGRSREG
ncbi:hypothetical protein NMY22_g18676 [Coprinellus aureogranulatus]|nr:hypothetical protein NMY22_g18676 [Coprinellus aureogranulatus]